MNPPTTDPNCPCLHPCTQVASNLRLLKGGEPFRFRRGDVLWEVGAPADRLVSVCTGAIKLDRPWPGDRAPIVDLVFRGGLAGLDAAAEGGRTTTRAVALAHGKGVAVSAAALQRRVARDPAVASTLLQASLKRRQRVVQRFDELGRGPVEGRIARTLLRVGDLIGLPDARGTFLPVALSRGDLAELVGCRSETAIRVMTRWQRAGQVETQREGIVLKDLAALREVAEAC